MNFLSLPTFKLISRLWWWFDVNDVDDVDGLCFVEDITVLLLVTGCIEGALFLIFANWDTIFNCCCSMGLYIVNVSSLLFRFELLLLLMLLLLFAFLWFWRCLLLFVFCLPLRLLLMLKSLMIGKVWKLNLLLFVI